MEQQYCKLSSHSPLSSSCKRQGTCIISSRMLPPTTTPFPINSHSATISVLPTRPLALLLSKLIERSQAKASPSHLKGNARVANPNPSDVQTSGTHQHQDRCLHPPYTRLDRATAKPVGVGLKEGPQGKASGDFSQPLHKIFDAYGQERDRSLGPRHRRWEVAAVLVGQTNVDGEGEGR